MIGKTQDFEFRGHTVRLYAGQHESVLSEEDKKKFIYHIRHSDHNVFRPSTIERYVLVNHYCILVSDDKIELNCIGNDEFSELTSAEKVKIRKEFGKIQK